jgi:hypothetical protein
MMKIDKLLTIDSSIGMSRFGWLKNYPVSPKADNMEDLVARLQVVRDIGLVPESVSASMKTVSGNLSVRQTFPKRANLNAMPRIGDVQFKLHFCSLSNLVSPTPCSTWRTS